MTGVVLCLIYNIVWVSLLAEPRPELRGDIKNKNAQSISIQRKQKSNRKTDTSIASYEYAVNVSFMMPSKHVRQVTRKQNRYQRWSLR